MGNNLSPMLAIIYMDYFEEKIIRQSNNKISVWLRYMDDIFFVTKQKQEELLNLANTIDNNIKFTLELPVDNKIPFLDIMLEVTNENKLNTRLYIKNFHSRHIIPWSSNTTIKQKIGVIKSERIRAIRLSSSKEMEDISINMIKEKFILNDYPMKYLKRYLLQVEQNHRRIYKNKKEVDCVIKLPFINEKISQKMQEVIKKSTLDMNPRIIFKTQRPLAMLLNTKKSSLCDSKCICDNHNQCMRKNTVYKITCALCKEEYIGETYRTTRTRIKEHIKQKSSEVYKHFQEKHNKIPTIEQIDWKVISSGYISSLHRKKAEENTIKPQKPTININYNNN